MLDGFLATLDPSQKKDLENLVLMVVLKPLYDLIWPKSGTLNEPEPVWNRNRSEPEPAEPEPEPEPAEPEPSAQEPNRTEPNWELPVFVRRSPSFQGFPN